MKKEEKQKKKAIKFVLIGLLVFIMFVVLINIFNEEDELKTKMNAVSNKIIKLIDEDSTFDALSLYFENKDNLEKIDYLNERIYDKLIVKFKDVKLKELRLSEPYEYKDSKTNKQYDCYGNYYIKIDDKSVNTYLKCDHENKVLEEKYTTTFEVSDKHNIYDMDYYYYNGSFDELHKKYYISIGDFKDSDYGLYIYVEHIEYDGKDLIKIVRTEDISDLYNKNQYDFYIDE